MYICLYLDLYREASRASSTARLPDELLLLEGDLHLGSRESLPSQVPVPSQGDELL